jgi:cupin fold WbuC family metalloprotein
MLAPVFSSQSVLDELSQQKTLYYMGMATCPIYGSSGSKLKERFVLFQKGIFFFETANSSESYEESFLILEGECEFVELDGSNQPINVRNLESLENSSNLYISPKSNSAFLLIIKSEAVLFFHAAYSSFSSKVKRVQDVNSIIQFDFRNFLKQSLNESIARESDKVFRRINYSEVVSRNDLTRLKEHLNTGSLDRARICVHKDNESLLQEMFIAFDQSNFVTPAYHPDKDESLMVLEGSTEIVLFDEFGNEESRVQLEPWGNLAKKPSFLRLRKGVIHTLLVRSDYALLKETTSGPFRGTSTVIPNWAQSVVKGDLNKVNFAEGED